MFTHILCNFTKEKASKFTEIEYIRVLGFSENGQKYLNQIKKELLVPVVTTLSKGHFDMLEYEKQVTDIYLSTFPHEEAQKLEQLEYSMFPLQQGK